jgi:hypothetical protein
MPVPTFIVIGAGRCGTTSLHAWLAAHPDIHMAPRKSLDFHVRGDPIPDWEQPLARAMARRRAVGELDDYLALFEAGSSRQAIGEISPTYLQSIHAAPSIHKLNPRTRIVAILRDPVERAYSHFLGRQRDGIEPPGPFAARVEREIGLGMPDEIAFGHYLGCSRYHHFLAPYLELFPRDQIRLYLLEDMQREPARMFDDLQAFLGLTRRVEPDVSRRLNRTGLVANPMMRRLWTGSARLRTAMRPFLPAAVRHTGGALFLRDVHRPPIDRGLRARLVELFRDDVRLLEPVLGRDLSPWLSA